MSEYLKPQSPLYHKKEDTYFYPLTTVDQVVLEDGSRLNTELSKHLMIDVNNTNEAEPNSINADTLGGYAADEYVRKDQYGIELNYSIVGSMEEPENPTQNMIWIQTETPIGRVFFGNNEPNETFMEGDVWIITGSSSNVEFNSLKIANNYVDTVCPISARQYISGILVDVNVMSYQNGEWVNWFLCLYNAGDECTEITGGFYYEAKRPQSNQNSGGTATLTKNQSNMILTHTSTSGAIGSGICATTNKIDLTDIKSITLEYSDFVKSSYDFTLSTWSNIGTYTKDNITGTISGSDPYGKIRLDTTALTGLHVVGVSLSSYYSQTSSITINGIYCEKE